VAHLARSMLPSSVNVYLNIVRIVHEEAGFGNPLSNIYELAMIKRGLQRLKGVPPRQKSPITVDILLKLYDYVDLTKNAEKAFWCGMLIGFYGFLRKSSLIPESSAVASDKRLNRGDISELS
jgi:hypothetical protein